MSLRAVLIGLGLALLVCGFNDLVANVFKLPSMINGGMPVVVFATVVVLSLGVNPALRAMRRVLGVPEEVPGGPDGPGGLLSGREQAVVLALGIVACGYTGVTFLKYLPTLAALPPHTEQTRADWRATRAMSYVPGYVGRIAGAHLRDPAALARRVVAERDADTAAGRLWQLTPEPQRVAWEEAAAAPDSPDAPGPPGSPDEARAGLTRLVNAILDDPALTRGVPGIGGDGGGDDLSSAERVAAGRRWLQAEMPDLFLPPPAGGGLLLNDGAYVPRVTDAILLPSDRDVRTIAAEIPWDAWWPVLRLWGGLMALLVLMTICLSVVVRPQWADHERLAFPLVRFVELMTERTGGHGLPDIARSKLFWVGFGVVGLHLVNGLHAWFPELPHVPLKFIFSPLRELFPNASRAWQASGVFEPTLFLTVVAFAFLLPTSVTLTFGIGNLIFLALAGYMTSIGLGVGGAARRGYWLELLNFGAAVAMIGAMLYTGRQYYARVAINALTFRRSGIEAARSPTVVWAFRALVVLAPLTVLHLGASGLSPLFAIFAVAMVLALWLISARIVSETGLLRYGQIAMPMSIASAFLAPEGIGPTNLIILTAVSVVLVTDLWESPMTFMVTGLQATRRAGEPERRVVPAIATSALLGLVVAIVATLVVQHQFGLLSSPSGTYTQRSIGPISQASRMLSDLPAEGVHAAIEAAWWERLAAFEFDGWVVGWTLAGFLLFALCTAARLRLPWWSIHPVLFVLLGNWGLVTFGASFLLGWIVKTSVMRIGGARAYYAVLPMMCGIIAGGLVSGVLWICVGLVYYILTGVAPARYTMF